MFDIFRPIITNYSMLPYVYDCQPAHIFDIFRPIITNYSMLPYVYD